jgi:hypothetical protein
MATGFIVATKSICALSLLFDQSILILNCAGYLTMSYDFV